MTRDEVEEWFGKNCLSLKILDSEKIDESVKHSYLVILGVADSVACLPDDWVWGRGRIERQMVYHLYKLLKVESIPEIEDIRKLGSWVKEDDDE